MQEPSWEQGTDTTDSLRKARYGLDTQAALAGAGGNTSDTPSMSQELDALRREIRIATAGLPPYEGDGEEGGVNYSWAPASYVLNLTLVHDPTMITREHFVPRPETKALLVQRALSDGHGTWSGVSGYIDILDDPRGQIDPAAFDPFTFTAHRELQQECGLSETDLEAITLSPGRRFKEDGPRGTIRHVLPMLGICHGLEKPPIVIDQKELMAHRWVPLREVHRQEDLSPGYLTMTLPQALGSLGLSSTQIVDILYPE